VTQLKPFVPEAAVRVEEVLVKVEAKSIVREEAKKD